MALRLINVELVVLVITPYNVEYNLMPSGPGNRRVARRPRAYVSRLSSYSSGHCISLGTTRLTLT